MSGRNNNNNGEEIQQEEALLLALLEAELLVLTAEILSLPLLPLLQPLQPLPLAEWEPAQIEALAQLNNWIQELDLILEDEHVEEPRRNRRHG